MSVAQRSEGGGRGMTCSPDDLPVTCSPDDPPMTPLVTCSLDDPR